MLAREQEARSVCSQPLSPAGGILYLLPAELLGPENSIMQAAAGGCMLWYQSDVLFFTCAENAFSSCEEQRSKDTLVCAVCKRGQRPIFPETAQITPCRISYPGQAKETCYVVLN